jgi:hypothetical protein
MSAAIVKQAAVEASVQSLPHPEVHLGAGERRKDLRDYPYGVIGSVGGPRFILASSHAEPVEYMFDYLSVGNVSNAGAVWEVTYDAPLEAARPSSKSRITPAGSTARSGYEGDIRVDGNRISIVARAADRRSTAIPLRVIREISLRSLFNSAGVYLHAAGARRAGRGILLIGRQRADTASMLMMLLRDSGGEYVAHSGGVATQNGTHLRFIGWPRAVGIELKAATGGGSSEPPSGRGQQVGAGVVAAHRPRPERMLRLSPGQFCRTVGSPVAMQTDVDLVLLARFDSGVGPLRLEPASKADLLAHHALAAKRIVERLDGPEFLHVDRECQHTVEAAKSRFLTFFSGLPRYRVIGNPHVESQSALEQIDKILARLQ